MNLKIILLVWMMIGSAWSNINSLDTIKNNCQIDKKNIARDAFLCAYDNIRKYDILDGNICIDGVLVNEKTGVVECRDNISTYFFVSINSSQRAYICSFEDVEIIYSFFDSDYSFVSGDTLFVSGGCEVSIPQNAAYISVSYDKSIADNNIFMVQENGSDVLVVSKAEGEISSIRKAVNNVNENDNAFVLVFPGTYEENVKAWGKDIVIWGIDRENCILSYKTSSYYAPPLEMACGGVYNMTIRATGGKSEDKPGAYGIHVEDNSLYENDLVFYNCDISSKSNSAIGMGMRGDCRVLIEKCNLTGYATGIFAHDSAYLKYTGKQDLIIRDCIIEGSSGRMAMRLDSQGVSGATINVTFTGNKLINNNSKKSEDLLFVQNNGGRGKDDNWMGLKNYYITPESSGNSDTRLNYGN